MKLAIITSHPIQYYAPWFRYIAIAADFSIKVFYLWDFGVTEQVDTGFQQAFQWDIPLLDGYEHEFVPNTSSNPGVYNFWGLQNPDLISQVRNYQPDAVLLMVYNYASLYRLILNWDTRKAPLLFRGDSHRLLPQTGWKASLRRMFISQMYRRFSGCLYVGKANYDYFTYHGVPSKRLFFSPHAVDNQRFFAQAEVAKQQAIAWKKELGIPDKHKVILFAGKFEDKKRPLDLLQAFLRAGLTETSLLFVGAGPLEDELKLQAASSSSIYFAPFQNQTMMPRTYAIADIVVLPSYSSHETWGLAINEAMCLSRPVIVSNYVGCAQDLVHPHKNGLIFPAGDINALTDCLQQALVNPEKLKAWGEQSSKIISNYSYIQATQGLREALNYVT
jgi:glycosyltransferase involved in cell wall biosynthesis